MATKEPASPDDLLSDPLLRDAPTVEGFKVLDPAVLYAKIGAGGMRAVYRGRHFKLDLDVAVKCLKPSLAAEDADFVKRFEREARLAASIAHQNVVRVMDVQEKNGLHYLVMEFVRGETARERRDGGREVQMRVEYTPYFAANEYRPCRSHKQAPNATDSESRNRR